jgi:exosortase A-associated hydrolase 2
MAFEPFFLPAGTGHRFCLFHAAKTGIPVRGAVVYIHPLAEEMNRARRMAALQSRAMASAGYAVLQIDLHGCGDSSGDFGDASWAGWVDDVLLACVWLRQRVDSALWLWGLRAGCLLAAEAARRDEAVGNLLFWQPAFSGKGLLEHLLRMKNVREKLSGEGAGHPKETLPQDALMEIAGYALSPRLTDALRNAELVLPERSMRVECLEVSGAKDPGLSPVSSAWLEKWRERGQTVRGLAVHGPSFWQTTETTEAPELLAATLAALQPCKKKH